MVVHLRVVRVERVGLEKEIGAVGVLGFRGRTFRVITTNKRGIRYEISKLVNALLKPLLFLQLKNCRTRSVVSLASSLHMISTPKHRENA